MGKRRTEKFNRSANKGRTRKKSKKRRTGVDWYTSDSAIGAFGALSRKPREGVKVPKEAKDTDTAAGALPEAGFDAILKGEEENDAQECASEESERSEYERQAYDELMELVMSSTDEKLGEKERLVFERVRREQEGLEVDEEDSESLIEKMEDENEHDGEEEQDDSDWKNNVFDVEGNDQEDARGGAFFDERFVNFYATDADNMEEVLVEKEEQQQKMTETILLRGQELRVQMLGYTGSFRQRFEASGKVSKSPEELASKFQLKDRLGKRWLAYAARRNKLCKRRLGKINEGVIPKRNAFGFTKLQCVLYEPMSRYADVVFSCRSLLNASELRELYVLHALNHVMKSRDLVLKHDMRIKMKAQEERRKKEEAIARGEKLNLNMEPDPELETVVRDQGFTRPRVLFLLPTRHAALKVIRMMLDLLPAKTIVANKQRIFDEFCEDGELESEEVKTRNAREQKSAAEAYNEIFFAAGHHPNLRDEAKRRKDGSTKPLDWHNSFAGNTDECFRIGAAFQGRKSVRFFTDFFKSDVILASPVGLRMATGQDIGDITEKNNDEEDSGQIDEAEDVDIGNKDDHDDLKELGVGTREQEERDSRRKDREMTDFLSSIEICVVDQVSMMEMQNMQHLIDVLAAVNRKPIEIREEMDFGRIRPYFLVDNLSCRFRQNIVLSSFQDPFMRMFSAPKDMKRMNLAGCVSISQAKYEGILQSISISPVRHKFARIDVDEDIDPVEKDRARVARFENEVLPALVKGPADHVVVMVPTYFEYISLRKLFRAAAAKAGETGRRARGKPMRKGSKNQRRSKEGGIEQVLFVAVSEYTPQDDVSRARGDFFHGRARVLLTTERFHFYNRYRLRGIERIIWYTPPLHADFYLELTELVGQDQNHANETSTVNMCFFDHRDALALERIVGTARAKKMLSSGNTMFTIEIK